MRYYWRDDPNDKSTLVCEFVADGTGELIENDVLLARPLNAAGRQAMRAIEKLMNNICEQRENEERAVAERNRRLALKTNNGGVA